MVSACMHVVTGRSDLDYPTDRLDSIAVKVLVNEGVQGLLRRGVPARRAPPGQNTHWPNAESHLPYAAHDSRVPEPP